jgi:hypothetical protein
MLDKELIAVQPGIFGRYKLRRERQLTVYARVMLNE